MSNPPEIFEVIGGIQDSLCINTEPYEGKAEGLPCSHPSIPDLDS